jgi:hypothetical protein
MIYKYLFGQNAARSHHCLRYIRIGLCPAMLRAGRGMTHLYGSLVWVQCHHGRSQINRFHTARGTLALNLSWHRCNQLECHSIRGTKRIYLRHNSSRAKVTGPLRMIDRTKAFLNPKILIAFLNRSPTFIWVNHEEREWMKIVKKIEKNIKEYQGIPRNKSMK